MIQRQKPIKAAAVFIALLMHFQSGYATWEEWGKDAGKVLLQVAAQSIFYLVINIGINEYNRHCYAKNHEKNLAVEEQKNVINARLAIIDDKQHTLMAFKEMKLFYQELCLQKPEYQNADFCKQLEAQIKTMVLNLK